jgi:hypothetical protein
MRSDVKSSLVGAFVAAVIALPCPTLAENGKSGTLATGLVKMMADRNLEGYAIEDPARPGYFVAVRSYPGVQLLLVEARSTATDYIRSQIAQKEYVEVYSVLNSTAVPDTKLFFQDMGCDGLTRDGDQIDVMYEQAVRQVVFDGKGKASGLSKSEYNAKLGTAEAQYTAMVTILLDSLKSTASSSIP